MRLTPIRYSQLQSYIPATSREKKRTVFNERDSECTSTQSQRQQWCATKKEIKSNDYPNRWLLLLTPVHTFCGFILWYYAFSPLAVAVLFAQKLT